MGMDALGAFAFKFLKAALARDGLAPEELRDCVQNYGLFTPVFCKKAMSVVEYHKVMKTFATHIIAHEEDFDGRKEFADLILATEGWLPYYLYNIKMDVRGTIEAIRQHNATMGIGDDNESGEP